MPRLQTKGSVGAPIASHNKVPTAMAESESRVVLSAFRNAVETVMELASTPNKSPEMERVVMSQLLTLKVLYDELQADMDQISLMLAVATDRTMTL